MTTIPKIEGRKKHLKDKKIKARKYKNGVWNEILPWYMVATQLNTLIAEGMATKKVRIEKIIDIIKYDRYHIVLMFLLISIANKLLKHWKPIEI